MPVREAMSESVFCRRSPSGPASAKPPDSILDCRRHQRSRDEDDGQIHRIRYGADGGITGQTFDLSVFRIDGENSAGKAEQDIFEDGVAAL
jgi:hypothetical protein